ncbi:MAG: energy transducer TonB [Candidatus Omnitrophota bacterium]
MLNDKVIRIALLISLAGHCLFLGSSGFSFRLPQYENQPEAKELTVDVEIDRSALLPKIDIMGQEKKFKEVKQKLEHPKPELKPHPLPEQIAVQQTLQERIEEKVDVVNPDKEAMFRYQDMVKQRIEQARIYPLWAKKHGMEGITHLYFTILPSGIGQDIKIIHSSGSIILDEEAVATVKRASPFHPVPGEINSSSVGMEVAIVFSLSKNYRRCR